MKFQITFTPVLLGNSTAYILFKLNNNKAYLYKVKVFGVENAFELRPIYLNSHQSGKMEPIPIYMKNPYLNQSLTLYCVQIPDKQIEVDYHKDHYYEPTCCPCNPFITIPPQRKVKIFSLVQTLRTSYLFTIFRIKGYPNFNITLPLIIMASNSARIYPTKLDFGILNPLHIPYRIPIKIDTKDESVTIHGLLFQKSPYFYLNFPALLQKPTIIPKSPTPTILGYIVFHAQKPGLYESSVFIHTNHSEAVKLELKGEVIEKSLIYDEYDTSIDVTNKPTDRNYLHEVSLFNVQPEFMAFTNVQIDRPNVRAELACPYSSVPEPLKKCTRILAPNYKDIVFHIKYAPMKENKYPFTSYATLLTPNKMFQIPLTVFDSYLTCQYTQYAYSFQGTTPTGHSKKCNEIQFIDLGIFSDETKAVDIQLMNPNPLGISVTNMMFQYKSSPICFELIAVKDNYVNGNSKEYTWGKTNAMKENEEFNIPPYQYALLRIFLSLDDCTRGTIHKVNDGDSFTNFLSFKSGDTDNKIKLNFRYHSGEFSFSPSRMRFEPGFSGTTQYKELRSISTFKVPLNILRTWTTDKRVQLNLNVKQVTSESKTEIGVVSFSPGDIPEEQNFLAHQRQALSWEKSAISLRELKLWRERQAIWDNISSTGGTVIDAHIYLDTDIVQNVRLPVKAELTQPILVQENEINFKLIENGTTKHMSIQIYNPSTDPMTIQLFAADQIMANYKVNSPLSFGKSCSGNFSVWYSKYLVTARQIRKQEKLTEYKSFEEFAEEYCCYMGKYNSSVLYSFKDDLSYQNAEKQQQDSDLNITLMRFCDSKDVAAYTPLEPSQQVPTAYNYVEKRQDNPPKSIVGALWDIFKQRESHITVQPPPPVSSGYFTFPSTYSKYPLIVDAMSYFTVGPFLYNPANIGEHSTMIFIKNNLTILYPLKLKGESGIGTLEFEEEINRVTKQTKLINAIPFEHAHLRKGQQNSDVEYKLTRADLLVTMPKTQENQDSNISNLWSLITYYLSKLDHYEYKVRKEHERAYMIKNTGNMPLSVTGITIDGRGCKASGLAIKNCEPFTLNPQQQRGIIISYSASLAIASSQHSLTFITKSGPQTFTLWVKLPFGILTTLQRIPALERYF